MNHLVFLNAQAGELEKTLSGVKTMLIKEFDPAQITAHPVRPGDSLYFLRDNGECAVRVKATVVRVLFFTNRLDQDLSHTLKELQPRLQLTEEQYNTWSARKQVLAIVASRVLGPGHGITSTPHRCNEQVYQAMTHSR